MKKFILTTLLVLIIPFFTVKIFTKIDNINFKYISNQMIKVKNEQTNEILTLPFEEYIKGVVSGEMPANFELEALKAQAVASRSYALYKIQNNKNTEYDIVNTTANQVYLTDEELKEKWKDKYTKNINKIKKAINETSGEYLTYQGKVANALFFSTSTGKTENSEDVFVSKLPYLRSVESTWDELSPSYTSVVKMDLKTFYEKLNLTYNDTLNIEVLEKTNTGRVKKIKINDIELNGRDVATKLNLKSNCFEIINENSNLTITTKGFGHGVGMSQYGANGMAKEGYKYNEILSHYYNQTKIEKI